MATGKLNYIPSQHNVCETDVEFHGCCCLIVHSATVWFILCIFRPSRSRKFDQRWWFVPQRHRRAVLCIRKRLGVRHLHVCSTSRAPTVAELRRLLSLARLKKPHGDPFAFRRSCSLTLLTVTIGLWRPTCYSRYARKENTFPMSFTMFAPTHHHTGGDRPRSHVIQALVRGWLTGRTAEYRNSTA